jgi:uncharacterized membrane protein
MHVWIILGVAVVIVVIVFIYLAKVEAPGDIRALKYFREVRENPIRGEAKIVSIDQTFAREQSIVYKMTVEVRTEDDKIYTLKQLIPGDKVDSERWTIPIAHTHYIKKGATLPILIHPKEKEYIYFEFEVDEMDTAWRERLGS